MHVKLQKNPPEYHLRKPRSHREQQLKWVTYTAFISMATSSSPKAHLPIVMFTINLQTSSCQPVEYFSSVSLCVCLCVTSKRGVLRVLLSSLSKCKRCTFLQFGAPGNNAPLSVPVRVFVNTHMEQTIMFFIHTFCTI